MRVLSTCDDVDIVEVDRVMGKKERANVKIEGDNSRYRIEIK